MQSTPVFVDIAKFEDLRYKNFDVRRTHRVCHVIQDFRCQNVDIRRTHRVRHVIHILFFIFL